MTKPLRIGLIGVGVVSRYDLIAWSALGDNATVVAIADPSHENAARRTKDCYRLSGSETAR